jgi:hypothetical protein
MSLLKEQNAFFDELFFQSYQQYAQRFWHHLQYLCIPFQFRIKSFAALVANKTLAAAAAPFERL